MKKNSERGAVSLSGGLDSTVALGIALQNCASVATIFVEYGQKTQKRERASFDKLNEHYGDRISESRVINLSWLETLGVSALFDSETLLDESNPQAEYVPFRNTLFLACLAAYAESQKMDAIYIGSTGGDRICPDNSPEFIAAFQEVLKQGSLIKKDIELRAPLLKGNKIQVVKQGHELATPFELTWSCHNSTEVACGRCSNCRARLQAFEANGLKDPIPYESLSAE